MPEEQEKKKNWFMRHKIATILIILFVIAGISSDQSKKKEVIAPVAPVQDAVKETVLPKDEKAVEVAPLAPIAPEAVKKDLPKYQVVDVQPSNGIMLKMFIYTQEKSDQGIIALTDNFIEINKDYPYIFIKYFDDREAAVRDSVRVSNGSSSVISDSDFSHNVADLKYNQNGSKILIKKQKGDWVELKKY